MLSRRGVVSGSPRIICTVPPKRQIAAKRKGLSPKTYSLMMRFKKTEENLRRMPAVRWRDMPFAHGYHDQNHFIKDFKRFTGHTPSDYLMNSFEIGRTYLSAR